jgi:hypothetical protein
MAWRLSSQRKLGSLSTSIALAARGPSFRWDDHQSLKHSTQATRTPGYFDGRPEALSSRKRGLRFNRKEPRRVRAKAPGTCPAMFSSI